MIKKLTVFLCLVSVLISSLIFTGFAADTKIRMADVNLPEIVAELSGDISENDISSVKLNGESLKVADVQEAESSTKLVYILIDISGSMSQSAVNSLKPSLISYAKSFDKKNDKLVLMTFGTEVKTLLSGGESDDVIERTINSIVCNSSNTTFYKALNEAYTGADKETGYDRKFAIVVSDGADLEKGNSSQEEVVDNYKTHRFPMYALCCYTATKSSSDGFGYIARISGGELLSFSSGDAASKFTALKDYFNGVTVVKMTSKSKKSAGTKNLDFVVGGEKVSQEVLVKAKSDNKAPTVKSIEYDKENNSFRIKFSEEVDNADNLSSFKIKKGNKELTIVSAEYKSRISTVYMEDTVYSGEYTFEFSSITDASDNANELDDSKVTEDIKARPIILKIIIIFGIVLIPVAFLAAIYFILISVKKKKNVKNIKEIFIVQEEIEHHETVHIKEKKGLEVKFYIDGADGSYHTVNYNLISSVIVGRNDMCDLRIDDSRLSRQHFAIEQVETGLAVTDLNSSNGTFINGVRVGSRTFLRSGDRISAGNSVIRVVY